MLFRHQPPEFVAVILASSTGQNLDPITSAKLPKHLLQVAGVPVLYRLIQALQFEKVSHIIIAISYGDSVTLPSLVDFVSAAQGETTKEASEVTSSETCTVIQGDYKGPSSCSILRLSEDCIGSGEALQQADEGILQTHFSESHVAVLPGDLLVLDHTVLQETLHQHRLRNRLLLDAAVPHAACTVLVTDVTVLDDNGVPLKESSKAKRGGLAREESEVEYMAISKKLNRLVWKQSKVDAEDAEGLGAASPKLAIPASRMLKSGPLEIKTNWSDVHVYIFAPWVRKLLQARDISTLREELLQLLISRQFKGVAASFGGFMGNNTTNSERSTSMDRDTILESVRSSFPYMKTPSPASVRDEAVESTGTTTDDIKYAVQAAVHSPNVFRINTVPAFLYANRRFVPKSLQQHGHPPYLKLPPATKPKVKFQSILLADTNEGAKLNCRSTVIGRRCKIGDQCRMNNVVIGDDCEVGDQTILQNTVLGADAKVGPNCNLDHCTVGPGRHVDKGTKGKGELGQLPGSSEPE